MRFIIKHYRIDKFYLNKDHICLSGSTRTFAFCEKEIALNSEMIFLNKIRRRLIITRPNIIFYSKKKRSLIIDLEVTHIPSSNNMILYHTQNDLRQ